MAILKSIVTLIYRELLALGRKIDIFKLIYTDIKSYVPYCSVEPPHKELFPLL
jgi:hypothetical protein